MPLRASLLILLTSVMCTYAVATTSGNRNQYYLGANIEIQPNSITRLKLPVKSLKGSHLNTNDVLQISFKDKGSITIYTITKESLGFSVDMRDYPKHIMGIKKTDKENEYASLINTTIKDASVTYRPLKTALFKTHSGDGYLTIGLKNSAIYLTDTKTDSVVTKIHIEGMSEQDINGLIIKGLL